MNPSRIPAASGSASWAGGIASGRYGLPGPSSSQSTDRQSLIKANAAAQRGGEH